MHVGHTTCIWPPSLGTLRTIPKFTLTLTQVYVRTYVRTYVFTYVRTYVSTHVRTYVPWYSWQHFFTVTFFKQVLSLLSRKRRIVLQKLIKPETKYRHLALKTVKSAVTFPANKMLSLWRKSDSTFFPELRLVNGLHSRCPKKYRHFKWSLFLQIVAQQLGASSINKQMTALFTRNPKCRHFKKVPSLLKKYRHFQELHRTHYEY